MAELNEPILWKCLGPEYLLRQGPSQRVVSSELWWATVKAGVPTPTELIHLWSAALMTSDYSRVEQRSAFLSELTEDLRTAIKELELELADTRQTVPENRGTREEVERLQMLLLAARGEFESAMAELKKLRN